MSCRRELRILMRRMRPDIPNWAHRPTSGGRGEEVGARRSKTLGRVQGISGLLGFIYIRAKANAKVTSLLTSCMVSNLCIYTTVTAVTANMKEKYRFRSNINEPLLPSTWSYHRDARFDKVNHDKVVSRDPLYNPTRAGGFERNIDD